MKSLTKLREELTEGTRYSSDFKLSPEGRKIHQHRINFGGYDKSSIVPKDQSQIDKEFEDKLEGKNVNLGKKVLDKIVQKRKKEEFQTPQQQNESVMDSTEPPLVLVLKRKSIRLFGDGTKVALYHSAALNKIFTVALNANMSSNFQAETYDVEIEFVNRLNSIDSITEEEQTALLQLYSNLSEENQQTLYEKLFESESSFEKIKMFALENL